MSFNIKNAKIIIKKESKKIVPLRNYRYVIYRYLSVGDTVLLKVYDKHVGRYVFVGQGRLRNGTKLTDKVRNMFRGHKFIDKIDDTETLLRS